MRKVSTQRREPGPNIVRAWFDTVFRDLLNGLTAERMALKRRHWGWHFRPPRLEYVAHARDYLASEAADNFSQLLTFHPEAQELVLAHDRGVTQLLESCKDFQEALTHSSELTTLYQKIVAECPTKLGADISSFFGAYSKEQDFVAALAENVVNHFEELPAYYADAPIWNHYRAEFDSLRTAPHLSAFDQAVKETVSLLGEANEALDTGLRQLRSNLSLDYDMPIVAEISRAR